MDEAEESRAVATAATARPQAGSAQIELSMNMKNATADVRKRALEDPGLDSTGKRKAEEKAQKMEARAAEELDKCFGFGSFDSD